MAGYDELIRRLGETPLNEGSALANLENVDQLARGTDPEDATVILEEAVEKTLRCADLLDKAIRLSHKFNHSMHDNAEDIHGDAYASAVRELIAADESVDAVAQKSQAFHDASKASRALLAHADPNVASSNDDAFHDLYLEEFATVFGDELDRFRQDDTFEAKDVSYLISCIKGGADVYSPLEKALFLAPHST
ncbi:hypothetical protein H257_11767 [Aphanomyces astaci]|uniref:Ribosome assembly protein 3 n=1 Tax=Aphanomyces astaci TaxID=112090 RepID=W4G317_APHAT|nr:hypothetical protein H257_11767 [Aphanomyces astaci]ETV73666.1 hypothetical protein H257_11767 [Aphanomyces astaci]RHY07804.1 hypothetical protein DYB36_002539 [Aphanomyces astaci]RHY35597.1 hypothetical protein DYB34_004129 [Aphanomyces astaci]RHY38637.1 hypothetical protein DYB30_007779 [Aphanomyces astaci]RHY66970.1 hypothetical protein DYB38_003619 [Aphanomyces astaci]|eukprot:XP_009837092.1 hypothetical protein H257_11767 [Aphanomyces astaci]